MALDYAKTARDIVEKAGGEDNITTVAHCMTRLRFTVKTCTPETSFRSSWDRT